MPGSDRRAHAHGTGPALTPEQVRAVVSEAIDPGHFFVGPTTTLAWEHVPLEEVPWEVFRGRLLDPAHTRARRSFAAWNVLLADGSHRPAVLAVKVAAEAGWVRVRVALLGPGGGGEHPGRHAF